MATESPNDAGFSLHRLNQWLERADGTFIVPQGTDEGAAKVHVAGGLDDLSSELAEISAALGGGVTAGAVATATVGSASTVVLAASASRRVAVVTNLGDEVVYLAVGAAAVSGRGIPLAPAASGSVGGSVEIVGPMAALAINGICASGGKTVAIQTGSVV